MPKSKANPVISYQTCDSSQVSAFGYDPVAKVLGMKFKGGGGSTYHYFNVPPEVFAALCSAESVGKFLSANIKGKYLFERQPDKPGELAYGLVLEQSSKYTVNTDGRICNRTTGKAIPDDEPVFILRASDENALYALREYLDVCANLEHIAAVTDLVDTFFDWSQTHPDRMKEPDTTPIVETV